MKRFANRDLSIFYESFSVLIVPFNMDMAEDSGLIGRRVRIRAIKKIGSAYKLNGLTAVITGLHPITPDWYMIHLDENEITNELEWSIPASRVTRVD